MRKVAVYWLETTDHQGRVTVHGSLRPTRNAAWVRLKAVEHMVDPATAGVLIRSKYVDESEVA